MSNAELLVPCNFDYNTYNKKPDNDTVRGIKMNLGKGFVRLPVQEIVHRLTNGQAMGFFGLDGMSAKNFKEARQFGLDFDHENLTPSGEEKRKHNNKKENLNNKIPLLPEDFLPIITYEDVKARLQSFGIPIAYTIKTLSYGKVCPVRNVPLHKFKCFILTNEVITDPKEAEKCLLGLLSIFPEADASGKDLARFTFGTCNGLVGDVCETPISKSILLGLYDKFAKHNELPEKEPYIPKKTDGEKTLDQMYEEFDLLGYMQHTHPECRVRKEGNRHHFTPHPFTGSPKSKGFAVYDDNTFCDYSQGEVVGNIFTIMTQFEGKTPQDARDEVCLYFGIDNKKRRRDHVKEQRRKKESGTVYENGLKMSIAKKADFPTLPPEEKEVEVSPQLKAARNVLDSIGNDNLIFSQSFFWKWRGNVWDRIEDVEIKQIIQQQEEHNPKMTASFVNGVFSLIQNMTFKVDQEFDVDKESICVKNGELNLVDGEWVLSPHEKKKYRTSCLPVEYDKDAECPRFAQFLDEIFVYDQDKELKQMVLLQAIGYSLMASCQFEKFFLLIGQGANGKSKVLDVLQAILGTKNVCAVQPSQFENKFQKAHLSGKLANIVSELAEGASVADAEIKAIVSGEICTAERKLKPPFDFYPYATCWFASNHMPHSRDFSHGFFRRAVIIQFNRRFEEEEQDKNLEKKLVKESSGVLNLALMALKKLLQDGNFIELPSSNMAKDKWKVESDQVAQFLEECCVMGDDYRTTLKDAYTEYNTWASQAGIRKPVNKSTFSKRLSNLGLNVTSGAKNKTTVFGAGIVTDWQN